MPASPVMAGAAGTPNVAEREAEISASLASHLAPGPSLPSVSGVTHPGAGENPHLPGHIAARDETQMPLVRGFRYSRGAVRSPWTREAGVPTYLVERSWSWPRIDLSNKEHLPRVRRPAVFAFPTGALAPPPRSSSCAPASSTHPASVAQSPHFHSRAHRLATPMSRRTRDRAALEEAREADRAAFTAAADRIKSLEAEGRRADAAAEDRINDLAAEGPRAEDTEALPASSGRSVADRSAELSMRKRPPQRLSYNAYPGPPTCTWPATAGSIQASRWTQRCIFPMRTGSHCATCLMAIWTSLASSWPCSRPAKVGLSNSSTFLMR